MLLRPKTKTLSITKTLFAWQDSDGSKKVWLTIHFSTLYHAREGGWGAKKLSALPQGENQGGAGV